MLRKFQLCRRIAARFARLVARGPVVFGSALLAIGLLSAMHGGLAAEAKGWARSSTQLIRFDNANSSWLAASANQHQTTLINSDEPIATDTPTNTDTPTATATGTPTNTDTPTATATDTPTNTNTPTATATDTPASTDTPTATATGTPTLTGTPTATDTPTPTVTRTKIPSPTVTHTPTATRTQPPTPTGTGTPPPTQTATATGAPTNTPTAIPMATARPGCVLYPSADVPRGIPDNSPGGIDSTLFVPGPAVPLFAIAARLDNLRHTYDSDLIITLIGPDDTQVILANRVGADTDNFYHTVLFDRAATAIFDGVGPFTGAYRPDQPLSAFNGHRSAGTWKLHVADVASGDVGTLQAWSLEACAEKPLYLPLVERP